MLPPRPFLTATWRDLALVNYEAPRRLLQPLVPVGTELDAYDNAALVSVVGFRFLDTRVLGMSVDPDGSGRHSTEAVRID